MWKGKLAHTYTLLIIQCLCDNYSSTQKINETKVNNVRNKTHTHTCFLIPMMKGYELKVKHQVNSRVSLIKKVRQGSIGNMKVQKTCLYASLNIYNVWVYIITSTQVVKNEKENMHTPRCNFLRRSSHNKLLQIFLWEKWGGGENTEASFSYICIQSVNSSQHINLYKKQHL